MRYLTVVCDQQCGLCTRLGEWLGAQPKWIGIRLLPSNLAADAYPTLAPRIAREELVVVSDDGGVYLGDHAWLMCLYALKHYPELGKAALQSDVAAFGAFSFRDPVSQPPEDIRMAAA
jgi:predicted DCC family thiol-disulfide oxidoreductase YuxK